LLTYAWASGMAGALVVAVDGVDAVDVVDGAVLAAA
jgi:hypothetical protein